MREFEPDPPAQPEGGGAVPILTALAIALAVGLARELLFIWADWRLGFSPPVWEIIVGWLRFSSSASLMMMVVALAAVAAYATATAARHPASWDARARAARVKRLGALFVIGAGGVAAFGGAVTWIAGEVGPVFEPYTGFSRFTLFMGVVGSFAAFWYLRRGLESL